MRVDSRFRGNDGRRRGNDGRRRGNDGRRRGNDGRRRGNDGRRHGNDGRRRGNDGRRRESDREWCPRRETTPDLKIVIPAEVLPVIAAEALPVIAAEVLSVIPAEAGIHWLSGTRDSLADHGCRCPGRAPPTDPDHHIGQGVESQPGCDPPEEAIIDGQAGRVRRAGLDAMAGKERGSRDRTPSPSGGGPSPVGGPRPAGPY